MKKLLLLVLALSLPLSQVVRADTNKKRRHQEEAEPTQASSRSKAQSPRRQIAQPALRQARNASPATRYSVAPVQRRSLQTNDRAGSQPLASRTTSNTLSRNGDRQPGSTFRNGQTPNRSVQRNRGNRNFNRNSFSVARSRVVRTRHDRGWWRNHYHTTFVLFGGGFYYFDTGYWYPAYGYSPIYNNYAYDEPIYGYNDLAPGQVLENVQLALRDEGYYRGAIDGLVGPETRAALAAYQRDHGLVETAAVDEPTLVTLGLT